ncbi:tetratricopeptide repeat protein [Crocosphaera sp.]|uniref:tetratricopeptide repeat protein n=1 Tax=Crocosphaera sp. TaxID=2729996 RepID=UPI00260BA15E|nr:tetratricopeptide repeat protein [Crocosphaera sp.]MDJ0583312.1 tetratricopeptide repeat protein [Crocosphaera sp.]
MNKSTQKIIVIVSGLALLVSMTAAGFSFRQNPSSSPEQANSGTASSAEERIKSIIEGYESVLQREPDNPTAKQGLEEALRALIATQIQAQNLEGAIPTLEKLAALVPDNEEYQVVLQQLKEAQKQAQAAPSPTQPEAVEPDSDEPLPLIIPEAQEESNPLLNPQENSNPLFPSETNPN